MESCHPPSHLPLHNNVKYYRQLAGLSQSQLAEHIGITRQAVSLIESGQNIPSTLVALRLARIFSLRVEDLFSEQLGDNDHDIWNVPQDTDIQLGDRVLPTFIGRRKVAHRFDILQQPQMLQQASEALSVLEKLPGRQVRIQYPSNTIVKNWTIVSGCDIGLALLTSHSTSAEIMRRIRPFWLNTDNSKAIRQLYAGDIHIAAVHTPLSDDNPPLKFTEKSSLDIRKIRFACWELGWIVQHGNPLGFQGVADLASSSFRIVNRPLGAGARSLLDSLLVEAQITPAKVNQYTFSVNGHLQVAQAISEGLADVGIGIASAAAAARLDFLPIQTEKCDLWIPADHFELEGVQRILETLTSDVFRQDLRNFGPYDVHNTGQIVT